MKRERRTQDVERETANAAELVQRARQRTLEELDAISCKRSPSYVAAISGNTPYATLPNGMTIVMAKCGNWGC